jgi:pimeloyl-ACP methyl ester carboxylesterase
MTPTGDSVVDVPGPWTLRRVAANGARFHLAEVGSGPLVVLLHGFPEFWWAWRHQLPVLAAAGYRAVAMDLRGYGGSDKTPRGYDPVTLAGDVAGVVRSLGGREAVVVGHGWGGFVGWATATIHPDQVRGLVAVAAPHPLITLRLLLRNWRRLGGLGQLLEMQLPLLPERRIMADDCAYVEKHLASGAAPGSRFPDPAAAQRYRCAMRLWPSPHCALEGPRWLLRSRFRSDGRRFDARMRRPVELPVLQVHGELDPLMARGDGRAPEPVRGPYDFELISGAGHFPHEESPDAFTKALLGWLERCCQHPG